MSGSELAQRCPAPNSRISVLALNVRGQLSRGVAELAQAAAGQDVLQESKFCFRATTPPIEIHIAPSRPPAFVRPVHPPTPRCISCRQILSRRPLRQP